MSKATVLAQVVEWLHNDEAAARTDEFWSRAKDAIGGDVFGADPSVVDWDLADCVAHESLWFYACMVAGHTWARDAAGVEAAGVSYRAEVARVGTSMTLRGSTKQLRRPYGT